MEKGEMRSCAARTGTQCMAPESQTSALRGDRADLPPGQDISTAGDGHSPALLPVCSAVG